MVYVWIKIDDLRKSNSYQSKEVTTLHKYKSAKAAEENALEKKLKAVKQREENGIEEKN